MKKIILLGLTYCMAISLHAQTKDKYSATDWQLADFAKDSVYGSSVTKAYNELLKGKKSHTVIVAVIDAGIDTAHEDLLGHIWTNKKEIPGNGIDDDHNGYVDDLHGWNFLGGKDGRNITSESLESEREYYRLNQVYAGFTDSSGVPDAKKTEYPYWLKLQKERKADSLKAVSNISFLAPVVATFNSADSIWKLRLHEDSVSMADIKTAMASDTVMTVADSLGKKVVSMYEMRHIPGDLKLEEIMSGVSTFLTGLKNKIAGYSMDPNAKRRDIVKDDFTNIKDRNYGNPNVNAGTPTHGTHVSGIIAATRNNDIGMNGVDDNVFIMAIRAVPDGDERDKDVALAIRYAVDNGAQIISMSFGKAYSPQKSFVDDAVKYAAQKDVLLVHAAGNEGKDLDTTQNYPSAEYLNNKGKAANYITVGANAGGPDSLLAASFSNYGTKEVDLFAPGVSVYSTLPGNKYASFSGTSMATPVVSAIAALVLEYYPKLTALQLKYVLEHSVATYPDDMVRVPGGKTKVKFSTLSRTGGIVNAYNALKLAATLKGERK
jgi:cell wall-associated protease